MSNQSGQPRRLWLLVLVFALAAAGAWYSGHRRSAAVQETVVVGQGRPQLLEFGMGICDQCKRMKPVMEQAATALGSTVDVHVLDIRQPDNERLSERFGLSAMPLLVLLDGTGKPLWRYEGFVAFDELSRAVRDHLVTPSGSCSAKAPECKP